MFKYKHLFIVALPVTLITIIAYLPALHNNFVNWDDNKYVYENPNIQSLNFESIQWMFTSFHAANWHPFTWLSHTADYAMWGLNPTGHHLTSIIFHGLNTFLVVVLMIRLISLACDNPHRKKPALIAGAVTGLLFGLHPLHVESVAWVSQRKNVLYSFFFLLSILSYLKYTSMKLRKKKILHYVLSILFFILSLMSKPMAVTLPAVLILLDWYPLKKLDCKFASTSRRNVLLEKLPFLILSLLTSFITFMAQQTANAVVTLETLSLVKRILIAVRALGFYLFKILWPLNLVPFYPYPHEKSVLLSEFFIAAMAVMLITALCIYTWRKQRFWSVAWIYYVVTLLPVLGIIKVGDQAAADRYTYLASLGPFFLFGSGVGHVMRITDFHVSDFFLKKVNGFILIILVIFIFLVHLNIKQQGIWKTSQSLWEENINQYPQSADKAYNNLGYAFKSQGNIEKAVENYKMALIIDPNYDHAHNNLGVALMSQGYIDLAMEHYRLALKIKPDFNYAHMNLGFAYFKKGNIEKAIYHLERAVTLNPEEPRAHLNLAIAYKSKGLTDKAKEHFSIARQLNPALFDMRKAQK